MVPAADDFYSRETLPGVSAIPLGVVETPDKVGPFPIECQLSKGGMSLLYLGIDPHSREPRAVKVLSPQYVNHPKMVDRFIKEAKIIALTHHPNIVKLYDQGRWEGGLYLAMEFVRGISLKQFILQNALSLKSAMQMILEVSYALFHLHTHGVIHRDLKPENILITDSGGVKVIDFGIAMVHDMPMTGEGTIGTPVYMPPEQLRDPASVTFNADIYALGMICYELVVGRLSRGKVHLELLPVRLRKILEQALEPDPSKRMQDIADLIAELNDYITSDDIGQDQVGGDYYRQIAEELQELQLHFLPQESPKLPTLALGTARSSSRSLPNRFLDSFALPDGTTLVVLLEARAKGIEGAMHAAIGRGVIHAVTNRLSQSVRSAKVGLPELADLVNSTLFADRLQPRFQGVLVQFDQHKDLCHVLNSGDHMIHHMEHAHRRVEHVESRNPLLGSSGGARWEVSSLQWQVNDLLSIASSADKSLAHKDSAITEAMEENRLLIPQVIAEAILRRIAPPQEEAQIEALAICFRCSAD